MFKAWLGFVGLGYIRKWDKGISMRRTYDSRDGQSSKSVHEGVALK